MKKLLSILAAVGLTATASTAVVACTASVKAKDGVASHEFKKIKLSDTGKAASTDAIAKVLTVTVKDGKDTLKASSYTSKIEVAKDGKDKVNVTVTITVTDASIAKNKKQTLKVEVTETVAKDAKSMFSKKFDQKFDIKLAKGESAKKEQPSA